MGFEMCEKSILRVEKIEYLLDNIMLKYASLFMYVLNFFGEKVRLHVEGGGGR